MNIFTRTHNIDANIFWLYFDLTYHRRYYLVDDMTGELIDTSVKTVFDDPIYSLGDKERKIIL